VAELLEDKKLEGSSYYKIASAHFAQGNFKSAIEAYLQSKNIFEEVNSPRDLLQVLSELGSLHAFIGDYERAERYSNQSLALDLRNAPPPMSGLPDQYGIAYAWANLGEVSLWKGDYDSALTSFQKSLVLWKELNREALVYRAHIIYTLTNIGITYKRMGDHARALDYFYQGLELVKTLSDRGRLAEVMANIGILYIEQSDYSKATELLDRSLRIFTEVNNKREIARTQVNIGVISQRLRRYDKALEAFQNGLNMAEEIDAVDIVITAQEGLGVICYEQGNYSAASEWFDRAWSLAQTTGDKIRMTEILWRKGQVAYSQGNPAESNRLSSKAADLASQYRLPLMRYLAFTLRGQSFRAQAQYELARESFMQAIETIERMRAQVAGSEKEQQLFFEDKMSPYHNLVSLSVEQNNLREALKVAERAKGRVLLDVLRNGRINISASLSEKERSEERSLYSEMVSFNTKIRAERLRHQPDDQRIKELETSLEKARTAYEALQASLYSAHPELKAKRGLFPSFEIEAADALIPDDRSAILEYVVSDEQVFLSILTRNSREQTGIEINVYPIKIERSELSGLVEDFRKYLAVNHPGFRQLGERLYDLLIKPAVHRLRGKSSLSIIPDSVLWNLPFQALHSDENKYLLEHYSIYYAPSIQTLIEMRKRADRLNRSPVGKGSVKRNNYSVEPGTTPHFYAVGNPAVKSDVISQIQTVRNAPYVSLPETEREVHTIRADVYGLNGSHIRIGAAASEDKVKTEMGKYRVIHFATHGVLNDRSPLYSYLLLAQAENTNEDGLLEAWELMNMDLEAEMVILSVCDTARGHASNGEGLIGMTWALFIAGVPTTIASQWQVPSETTTELMVEFHRNVTRMSKAEAMRQAALKMIRDPRYRMKPFYWAGFIVIGGGDR